MRYWLLTIVNIIGHEINIPNVFSFCTCFFRFARVLWSVFEAIEIVFFFFNFHWNRIQLDLVVSRLISNWNTKFMMDHLINGQQITYQQKHQNAPKIKCCFDNCCHCYAHYSCYDVLFCLCFVCVISLFLLLFCFVFFLWMVFCVSVCVRARAHIMITCCLFFPIQLIHILW